MIKMRRFTHMGAPVPACDTYKVIIYLLFTSDTDLTRAACITAGPPQIVMLWHLVANPAELAGGR
jgi:hypothetical protein